MADEKKAVAKAKKANFFVRFGRGFLNFFKKIGLAFKNMWHELQKVTWPTRDKLINYIVIVVLAVVFLIVEHVRLGQGVLQLDELLFQTFQFGEHMVSPTRCGRKNGYDERTSRKAAQRSACRRPATIAARTPQLPMPGGKKSYSVV